MSPTSLGCGMSTCLNGLRTIALGYIIFIGFWQMAHPTIDSKFFSNILGISRLIEQQSYFAIPVRFSKDRACARLPISLLMFRRERTTDGTIFGDTTPYTPTSHSMRYSYRARYCEITQNPNGTYNLLLPVTERLHVPGAEEEIFLGEGKFTIGHDLSILHLNLVLTNLFGKAGYFENSSMSFRATKAMIEVTGLTRKIPSHVAALFPSRQDITAHYAVHRQGNPQIRIQFK